MRSCTVSLLEPSRSVDTVLDTRLIPANAFARLSADGIWRARSEITAHSCWSLESRSAIDMTAATGSVPPVAQACTIALTTSKVEDCGLTSPQLVSLGEESSLPFGHFSSTLGTQPEDREAGHRIERLQRKLVNPEPHCIANSAPRNIQVAVEIRLAAVRVDDPAVAAVDLHGWTIRGHELVLEGESVSVPLPSPLRDGVRDLSIDLRGDPKTALLWGNSAADRDRDFNRRNAGVRRLRARRPRCSDDEPGGVERT